MTRLLEYETRLRAALYDQKIDFPVAVYRLTLTARWGRESNDFVLIHVGSFGEEVAHGDGVTTTGWIPEHKDLVAVLTAAKGLDLTGVAPVTQIFVYPPLLRHEHLEGVDVFFLGDPRHGIFASADDLEGTANLLATQLDPKDFFVYGAMPTSDEDVHLHTPNMAPKAMKAWRDELWAEFYVQLRAFKDRRRT